MPGRELTKIQKLGVILNVFRVIITPFSKWVAFNAELTKRKSLAMALIREYKQLRSDQM